MELDVIHTGDNMAILPTLEDESVDLVVTDPPYALTSPGAKNPKGGFMGKAWDKALPSVEVWRECLRVLKPGAFAFVMCIPRQDCLSRMIINLEDAGFNVAFSPILHAFATGFPKAMSISKAIDKRFGVEREVVGIKPGHEDFANRTTKGHIDFRDATEGFDRPWMHDDQARKAYHHLTAPATPEAKALEGAYAGYQPKPAYECILVAMRPLTEKTYLDQALANGHGCTWLTSGAIPVQHASERGNVASVHELVQDGVPDNVFRVLSGACERVQDSVSSTILCNKNYTSRVHHMAGRDYTLGNELSLWVDAALCDDKTYVSAESLAQDSQCDCPACSRLYDELSHVVQVDDQDVPPSQADVLAYIHSFALSQERNQHPKCTVRPSSVDGLYRILGVLVLGDSLAYPPPVVERFMAYYYYTCNGQKSQESSSRFAPNLLCSDDVLNDGRVSKSRASGYDWRDSNNDNATHIARNIKSGIHYTDSGSFSRYFSLDQWSEKNLPDSVNRTFPFMIVPKAGKREKNAGLDGLENGVKGYGGKEVGLQNSTVRPDGSARQQVRSKNHHPTCKPIKLMSYLIAIGSRPGDVVLDPYGGSGTTGIAAALSGRRYILMELDAEYVDIGERRIAWHVEQAKAEEQVQLKLDL